MCWRRSEGLAAEFAVGRHALLDALGLDGRPTEEAWEAPEELGGLYSAGGS